MIVTTIVESIDLLHIVDFIIKLYVFIRFIFKEVNSDV